VAATWIWANELSQAPPIGDLTEETMETVFCDMGAHNFSFTALARGDRAEALAYDAKIDVVHDYRNKVVDRVRDVYSENAAIVEGRLMLRVKEPMAMIMFHEHADPRFLAMTDDIPDPIPATSAKDPAGFYFPVDQSADLNWFPTLGEHEYLEPLRSVTIHTPGCIRERHADRSLGALARSLLNSGRMRQSSAKNGRLIALNLAVETDDTAAILEAVEGLVGRRDLAASTLIAGIRQVLDTEPIALDLAL
jgi:hypothetical protein